jgi:guanylate kinase
MKSLFPTQPVNQGSMKKNNKDYYFVNEDEFKRLINNQEFLEYAKVFNNFYGTT